MPRGAADLCVNAGFPGRQGSGKLELEPYGRYRQHGQPRKSGVGLLIFMEQGGLPAARVLLGLLPENEAGDKFLPRILQLLTVIPMGFHPSRLCAADEDVVATHPAAGV
jgi:hypothetical protein